MLTNGKYPVINSETGLYGYYDNFNNEGNAITIASRGANAGHIKYINEKFWAGGLCYPYRSLDENIINTKYIYYYLKIKESIIYEKLVDKGSIPALNKSVIEKFKITIPSLKKQKEIVSILDKLYKYSNDLKEGLPAEISLRKKQYEYYRNKLLSFN